MAKKLARVGLRFDADLWRRLCKMADDADISVNQLMQGVARSALKNGHVGEPAYATDGETGEH